VLTNEEKLHFDVFGFLVKRRYFTRDETNGFSRAFDCFMADHRDGKPFPGKKRQWVFGFVDKQPELRGLPEDDRIHEPIERLLGRDFVWIGSAGNIYVGDTGWHPDGSEFEYSRIKVVFYLDPVGRDSGCLRVIPGSHRMPLHETLSPLRLQRADPSISPFGAPPEEVSCVPLESWPGDVVFFNQDLWHASFGGSNARRMFTLNFAAAATKDEHNSYLREMYDSNRRNAGEWEFTHRGRLYDDAFLHSDRPRIQRMTAKLVELGFK
jgi:hypothetical protein